MSAYVEEDRIRAALSHVPADSRDTWVQMGMAIKSELGDGGFDLWDEWSRTGETYRERDASSVWRSFKGGGITLATLFAEAIAHGYVESEPLKPIDPTERARRDSERRLDAEIAVAKQKQEQADAAVKARDLWEKAGSVDASHTYVRSKKITPYGAKQLREQLIVKIQDIDGVHHSTQYVQPDGTKVFQTGGRISGCFAAVTSGAKPNGSTPLLICEGFATACSLHQATGYPAAAAMNAGNLLNVARAWREKYPRVRIVICADDDTETAGNPGMTKATDAARAVGGMLAVPDFGPSRPDSATDFNDLFALVGSDALRGCVEAAVSPGGVSPPRQRVAPSVLLSCASDIRPEAISWLWPGWLPAGKLTLLAGSPGTGKTTLAIALAASVTTGGAWPDGSKCQAAGHVLMWSGEDDPADTLVPRLMAAGADLRKVHFVQSVSDENGELQPFDPASDIPLLAERLAELGGTRLLIVDPIVSAVSGDAHRANDVRRNLQALVDMAAGYQCAVLGISHFAKGAKGTSPAERVIGSQAFVALARMVLVAGKDEAAERRILARAKSNIAPDDGGVSYTLEQIDTDGIEASRVVWGEMIEGTAREILGDVEQDDEEKTGQDEAQDFLESILAAGPMRVREIKVDTDGAGFNWKMMQRAGTRLNVEKRKIGMKEGWEWALPKRTNPEEDTKNPTLSIVSPSKSSVPFVPSKALRAVDFPHSSEGDTLKRVTPSANPSEVAVADRLEGDL